MYFSFASAFIRSLNAFNRCRHDCQHSRDSLTIKLFSIALFISVDRGDTLLMILIKCGRQDAIRWLVTCSGLDLSICNDAGNNAYSLAQHAGLSHLLPGYSGFDEPGAISLQQQSSFASSAPSFATSTSATEANGVMPPVVDAVPYDETVPEQPAYLYEGTAVQHASLLVFASNGEPQQQQQQQQYSSQSSSSNPEQQRFVGGRLVLYVKVHCYVSVKAGATWCAYVACRAY